MCFLLPGRRGSQSLLCSRGGDAHPSKWFGAQWLASLFRGKEVGVSVFKHYNLFGFQLIGWELRFPDVHTIFRVFFFFLHIFRILHNLPVFNHKTMRKIYSWKVCKNIWNCVDAKIPQISTDHLKCKKVVVHGNRNTDQPLKRQSR